MIVPYGDRHSRSFGRLVGISHFLPYARTEMREKNAFGQSFFGTLAADSTYDCYYCVDRDGEPGCAAEDFVNRSRGGLRRSWPLCARRILRPVGPAVAQGTSCERTANQWSGKNERHD